MGRILFFGIIVGLVMGWLGIEEFRLGSKSKAEPQQITMAELEANGYGDNAHVAITEFDLLNFSYVYKGNSETSMQQVWVPMVSLDSAYYAALVASADENGRLPDNVPLPEDLGVILVSKSARNDGQVNALAQQDVIEGMITNAIEELDSEEKNLLQQSYPAADLDTVLIFEQGRKPAGMGKKAGMLGGGALLFLACSGAMIVRLRSDD